MNALRLSMILLAVALTACGPADAYVDGVEDESGDISAELAASSRFETFKGKDGEYYFHLIAGNGEKVLQSQGYASLSGAKSGIDSVKNNGLSATRYLVREAVDGSHYFVLTATNGRIIGLSEMYASKANAERGATTVQSVLKVVTATSPAAAGDTRFESFKGLDGRYYFHLKANNGQIVLQSQSYASKSGATSGINSVRSNGANAARFEVREARDGHFYFVLKAGNGQVIGVSEMYESKSNAERGVTAVIGLLADAK